MASRAIAISTLLLRFLALSLSVGCIVVFVLNKIDFADGTQTTFKDIRTYRYVISAAVVGAAYSLLQLPFNIYLALTEKKMISGRFLPVFDLIGDKVISFVLASGVGAGFAVTFELQELLKDVLSSDMQNFLNKGYVATGLLLGAFLCMAIVSVLTSISYSKKGFFR